MADNETQAVITGHCREVARLLGVRQGSLEIHFFKGEPKKVQIVQSLQLGEPKKRA